MAKLMINGITIKIYIKYPPTMVVFCYYYLFQTFLITPEISCLRSKNVLRIG